MKVLVTGGSGFLGRSLTRQLLDKHQVYATYANNPDTRANANWIPFRFPLDSGSVNFPDSIDSVIHLAQSPNYRRFPAAARDIFNVNVASTQMLLEYAHSAGAKQFILASTGSVYAGNSAPIEEKDVTSPNNFYAASKLAAELLTAPYRHLFSVCILRLFYLYGPNQVDRLIPNLIQRVKTGSLIQISGDRGGLKLTPTYVDDAASVFSAALEGHWNSILNVGGRELISIREIGDAIGQCLNIDPKYQCDDGVEVQPVIPDISKLSACFDVSQFQSFSAGIEKTCLNKSRLDAASV